MLVIYTGITPLGYEGKQYKTGDKVEISESFFHRHRSRFLLVEDDAIEGEIIQNVEPKEIYNDTPAGQRAKSLSEPKPKRGRRKKAQ